MFDFLRRGKRRPRLGTLSIDPDDPTLRRPLRCYFSHRQGLDDALVRAVLTAISDASGDRAEDMSLGPDHLGVDPDRPPPDPADFAQQAGNRIRMCDFVILAATPGMDPDWMQMEVDAAAAFRRPVIFLASRSEPPWWRGMLAGLEQQGISARVCPPDPADLAWAARWMLPPRTV